MASVLEMSVQFLRLAGTLVPSQEQHAVSRAGVGGPLWTRRHGGQPDPAPVPSLQGRLSQALRSCRLSPSSRGLWGGFCDILRLRPSPTHGGQASTGRGSCCQEAVGGHGLHPPCPVLRTRVCTQAGTPGRQPRWDAATSLGSPRSATSGSCLSFLFLLPPRSCGPRGRRTFCSWSWQVRPQLGHQSPGREHPA